MTPTLRWAHSQQWRLQGESSRGLCPRCKPLCSGCAPTGKPSSVSYTILHTNRGQLFEDHGTRRQDFESKFKNAVRRIHKQKKQKTKGRTKTCDKLGVRPAYPLIPILTKFGMWGGLPNVFLKFEFQDDLSIIVGALGGGSKFAFSHWQGPSLIQQLATDFDWSCMRIHMTHRLVWSWKNRISVR